jgi:hypothetical protein
MPTAAVARHPAALAWWLAQGCPGLLSPWSVTMLVAMSVIEARRWWVHLGLIASFGVATLVLVAGRSLGVHIVAGVGFAILVVAHLVQRRRTVRTLATSLPSLTTSPRGRLALSDAVLIFLAANAIASGLIDWMLARSVMVGVPGMQPLNWHTTSSLLLIVYVVIHVIRRASRLRHSQIR